MSAVFGAGGCLVKGSVFAQGGKLILTPSGQHLKIISTITGELVSTLEGHDADITCVATNPKESSQVYTASKDGTIKLWDYTTLSCIKTLLVRETVQGMVFSEDLPIAYLSINWRDGASGRVITYDLDKGKAGRTAMKTSTARPLYCNGASRGCSTASTFVATHDKHSLFVWRVGEEIYQPLNLHHTKPYTCVAISADESMIAAGDASGRIQIWRSFSSHVPTLKREGQYTHKHHAEGLHPTTLHWHASAVGCLSFSPDGTYLLSGGREGVLVMWQLESGKPNFLPRLGGPLTRLQPSPVDPAKYLISQADNTLRLVSTASMKVEASILGMRPLPAGLPARAAADATLLQPGTGHLVVPCENAEMQLYDTVHDRHVALIKIVNRNTVSMAERGPSAGYAAPLQPYVQHAAFTASGSCLATVDVRPDSGAYGTTESCLKFWDLANATTSTGLEAPFTLNTRVDDPHSGQISSISCHPTADMVVTTGSDAEFRVWVRTAGQRRPGGKALNPSSWRCRSLGSYKGLALTASAFSHDGSVLAVAAGPKVTLWDPATCRLAAVLSLAPEHQISGAAIQKLLFVQGSPFVVGASDSFLSVWNILTASLHWALSMPITAMAADPVHGSFAVAVPLPGADQRQAARGHAAQAPAADAKPAAGDAGQQQQLAAEHQADREPASGKDAAASAAPAGAADAAPSAQPSAMHSSHVLIFEPHSPVPRFRSVCPGTLTPSLLYVPPGMPQHASSSDGLPGSVSPLLVLTEGRAYAYVSSEGQHRPSQSQPTAGPLDQGQVSSFEAAFGAVSSLSAVTQRDAMDLDTNPSGPRWKPLFDAPSHALPAPSALAQVFLRLITAE